MPRGPRPGAQFTTSIATQYTVPELVKLAELARGAGMERVWVNDNLRYRQNFVVLTAIASKVRVKLGTAVAVPYFRNPLDMLDSIVSLSELATGDLAIGLAKGSTAQAGHLLRLRKPITMLEEYVTFMKRLLRGERAAFADYPFLTEHFHMNPKAFVELSPSPKAPIHFYTGGNAPKSLAVGGRTMEGVLIGGYYEAFVKTGKLEGLLKIADDAARSVDPRKKLRKVAEINVSLSENVRRAVEDAKKYVSHAVISLKMLGFDDDDFLELGIEPAQVKRLEEAFSNGLTIEEARPFVTKRMVDAIMVTGNIAECKTRILEYYEKARSLGFDEVAFAKLGPDYRESISLLGRHVLPEIL